MTTNTKEKLMPATMKDIAVLLNVPLTFNQVQTSQEFNRLVTKPRDQVLVHDLFVVAAGTFKTVVSTPDLDQVVQIAHKGDVIGLDLLYQNVKVDMLIHSLDYGQLIAVPRSVVIENPLDFTWVWSVMAKQLRMLHLTNYYVNNSSAQAKVAWFLLDYSKCLTDIDCNGTRFRLMPSREDMASVLGLSMETVSREIQRLVVAGAINIFSGNREVTIKDFRQLERICIRSPNGKPIAPQADVEMAG